MTDLTREAALLTLLARSAGTLRELVLLREMRPPTDTSEMVCKTATDCAAALDAAVTDLARSPAVPEGCVVPSEADIDRALMARIPGGSNARDWFLPHDSERAKQNIRDVVKAMLSAAPLAAADGRREGKYRFVYNKASRKIDRVRNFDGLVMDSFEPPEVCEESPLPSPPGEK